MNQFQITRRMMRRAVRGVPATAQQAKALLEFGRANGHVLFGLKAAEAKKLEDEKRAAEAKKRAHDEKLAAVWKSISGSRGSVDDGAVKF